MDLETSLVSLKLQWFLDICRPVFSSHTCCPYPSHAPSPRGWISKMSSSAVSISSPYSPTRSMGPLDFSSGSNYIYHVPPHSPPPFPPFKAPGGCSGLRNTHTQLPPNGFQGHRSLCPFMAPPGVCSGLETSQFTSLLPVIASLRSAFCCGDQR